MITEYKTKQANIIKLGRVSRKLFDDFLTANPEPKPPTRLVEIFGQETEEIAILDDPDYLIARQAYNIRLFDLQFDVIAKATEFDYRPERLKALYHTGIPKRNEKADALRYIILKDKLDAANVAALVLYNSTVTQRGIEEALDRFGIEWNGTPIQNVYVRQAPVKYSTVYSAMKAALFCNVSWLKFCELSGPQQSEIVAFYSCEMRLQWLMSQK